MNHSKGANPNLNAGLYNGNIRGMFTALSDDNENAFATHQTNYTYDQLNRIKSMTGYNQIVGQVATVSHYSSNYSFDENGNLLTLQRVIPNGATGALMDNFVYDYISGTNKLALVHDDPNISAVSSEDIDDQATQLLNLGLTAYDLQSVQTHNYQYDKIGQLIIDKTEEIQEIEWKVNNKVKAIRRFSWSTKSDLEFGYDAMGNRISKRVIPKNPNGTINSDGVKTTYYILDAQGNQMAMYTHENDNSIKKLYLSERNIYGSSRIGQEQVVQVIASSNSNLVDINTKTQNIIGDKYFEMSNHLGNVLQVVSDRKLLEPDGNGGVDYFLADVVSYSDYYPYGMQLQGEKRLRELKEDGSIEYIVAHRSGDYRYGFNGMEKDDEVKGEGNHYDLGLRNYDPRLGRMFSIDPRANEYPWQTSYAYHRNSPINIIDYLGGGDGIYKDEDGNEIFDDGVDDGEVHYVKNEDITDFKNDDAASPMLNISPYDRKEQLSKYVANTDYDLSLSSRMPTPSIPKSSSSNKSNQGEIPNPGGNGLVPEISSDISLGVSLQTTMVDVAANQTTKEMGKQAPKILKTISKFSGGAGGVVGGFDNGLQTYNDIQKGNYGRATVNGTQTGAYATGTVMLAFPVTAPVGATILLITTFSDWIQIGVETQTGTDY